jgi:hypothetical protein
VTLPSPVAGEAAWGEPREPRRRGLPGGRVVTVATLLVVAAAAAEVALTESIGLWTDATLVTVSILAALVTRAGDRSLPAMMPPLAFLAAALVAGQPLVASTGGSAWTRQGLMLFEVLGAHAIWVVGATAAATVIALVRHLAARRR